MPIRKRTDLMIGGLASTTQNDIILRNSYIVANSHNRFILQQ